MDTKIFSKKATENNRKKLRNEMTDEEVILWSRLQHSKLGYKFRRQAGIGFYIADFYCPERKLVIELDGLQHLENKLYDNEREKFMENLGIKTIRFWNKDIRENLDGVINEIKKHLRY